MGTVVVEVAAVTGALVVVEVVEAGIEVRTGGCWITAEDYIVANNEGEEKQ